MGVADSRSFNVSLGADTSSRVPFCNVFDPTDFAGDPPAPRLVVNETMRIACWNVDSPSTFKLALALRDSGGHEVGISTPEEYSNNPSDPYYATIVSLLIPPEWWALHSADGPFSLFSANQYANYTSVPFPVAEIVTPSCTWPSSVDSSQGFTVSCTGVAVHLALFYAFSSEVIRLDASNVDGLSMYTNYGSVVADIVQGCNPARLADPFVFDCSSTVASQLASEGQGRGGQGFFTVIPRIQTVKDGLASQGPYSPGEQMYLYYGEARLISATYAHPCGISYSEYYSFVYLDDASGQPLAKLPFSFPSQLDDTAFPDSNMNQPDEVIRGFIGTRKYTAAVYVEPSVVAEALAQGRGPFGLRFVDGMTGQTVPSPRNITALAAPLGAFMC
eukprot:tig00020603_g11819.t1